MAWDLKSKKDFTYVGVGSCPHGPLTPTNDQLVPVFLRNLLRTTDKSVRIIHIDPYLSERTDFLDEYFCMFGLKRCGEMLWSDDRVEVCLYSRNYEDHETAELSAFLDGILEQGGELLFQMYTGRDTAPLFRELYGMSANRPLFLKKILFDITYGNDCGCATDLVKYELVYNGDGFLNLQLYSAEEGLALIKRRMHPMAREYFIRSAVKEFKKVLNNYHVDYRRRLRGEDVLFGGEYDSGVDPDDLMKMMRGRLDDLMKQLNMLCVVRDGHSKAYRDLFGSYREYDVYKWYAAMDALIMEMRL